MIIGVRNPLPGIKPKDLERHPGKLFNNARMAKRGKEASPGGHAEFSYTDTILPQCSRQVAACSRECAYSGRATAP